MSVSIGQPAWKADIITNWRCAATRPAGAGALASDPRGGAMRLTLVFTLLMACGGWLIVGRVEGQTERTRGGETRDRSIDPARRGRVRIDGHSFADDRGPFLGLGVSYFTALWRCKHDRARLE